MTGVHHLNGSRMTMTDVNHPNDCRNITATAQTMFKTVDDSQVPWSCSH